MLALSANDRATMPGIARIALAVVAAVAPEVLEEETGVNSAVVVVEEVAAAARSATNVTKWDILHVTARRN